MIVNYKKKELKMGILVLFIDIELPAEAFS